MTDLTDFQKLQQSASEQNVKINKFVDEWTPIQFVCAKCSTSNEEYPETLLSYSHWCPICRDNPKEILEDIFTKLNMTAAPSSRVDYKLQRVNDN